MEDWPINLTPHAVRIVEEADTEASDAAEGYRTLAWLPSHGEARARSYRRPVGTVTMPSYHGPMGRPGTRVAVVTVEFGEVDGLPAPNGRQYIVSRLAAEASRANGRSTDDLLIPDDIVRDPDGGIIGCRGFARL